MPDSLNIKNTLQKYSYSSILLLIINNINNLKKK